MTSEPGLKQGTVFAWLLCLGYLLWGKPCAKLEEAHLAHAGRLLSETHSQQLLGTRVSLAFSPLAKALDAEEQRLITLCALSRSPTHKTRVHNTW